MRTRLTSTSGTDRVPSAAAPREAESEARNARWFCACCGGEPCCARACATIQNTVVRRMGRQRYLRINVVPPSSGMVPTEAHRGVPSVNGRSSSLARARLNPPGHAGGPVVLEELNATSSAFDRPDRFVSTSAEQPLFRHIGVREALICLDITAQVFAPGSSFTFTTFRYGRSYCVG